MIRPTEDRLFDRYRKTGDARLLGRVFDRTAPELSRVAVWLCGRQDDAEDVVQSTFLTAIEDSARWDAERRLRPWLMGIVVNHVRRVRRQRRRTEELVDEGAARGGDPVAEAVERELAGLILGAVARLPEVYRDAVARCLLAGDRPGEAAAGAGVRPGTLRMRLLRGLDRMRTLLPAGTAVAGAVVLSQASLKAMRAVVLAHGRSTVPALGGTGLSSFLFGVFVMNRALTVAATLLVLAALPLWYLVSGGATANVDLPPGSFGTPASVAAADAEPEPPASARVAATSDSARTASAPGPRVWSGRVRVLVRNAETRAPVAGVEVAAAVGLVAGTQTDAGGRCVVELRAGRNQLQAGVFGRDPVTTAPFDVPLGGETEVTIDFPPAFALEVTVADRDGRLLADAAVWGEVEDPAHLRWGELGRTDAHGVLRHAAIRHHLSLFAVARGFTPSAPRSVSADEGARQAIRLVVSEPGARMHGRVVDGDGRGVPGAIVAVQGRDGRRPPLPVMTRTDADGRFDIETAPPGRLPVFASTRVPGERFGSSRRLGRAEYDSEHADRPVLIRVGAGACVRGHVEAGGDPSQPCTISAQFAEPGIEGNLANELSLSAKATRDGRYQLRGLVAGHYVLFARRGDDTQQLEVDLTEGLVFEWSPAAQPVRELVVRVVDEQSRPLPGWRVAVRPKSAALAQQRADTDRDGRTVFAALRDEAYVASVYTPELSVSLLAEEIEPGVAERTLQVTRAMLPSVRVRGRLGLEPGSPAAEHRVEVQVRNDWVALVVAAGGGLSCPTLLPPGSYSARVWHGHEHVGWTDPQTVAAGEVLDLGDVPVPQRGAIVVDAQDEGGNRLHDVTLGIMVRGERHLVPGPKTDKSGVAGYQAPAGTWEVVLWGPNIMPVREWATVRGGQRTRIEVTCRRAVCCTFDLSALGPRRVASVRVTGTGLDLTESVRSSQPLPQRGLAPGLWQIEALDAEGRSLARVSATVPAAGATTIVVR